MLTNFICESTFKRSIISIRDAVSPEFEMKVQIKDDNDIKKSIY